MTRIRIGIVGYGNLGRGVIEGLKHCDDMDLIAVFTRRDPDAIGLDSSEINLYHISKIDEFIENIDVIILCGSSKRDILDQAPKIARCYNTVDCFDNHGLILDYWKKMDKICKCNQHVSIISTGWDPGLFSINRLIAESILPDGETYTFWGKGVSQGHSDAVKKITGVKKAVQYTIPNEKMLSSIKAGKKVSYQTKTAHSRLVYVVLEDGADKDQIEEEIINMEGYFKGYETKVNFIDEKTFNKNHLAMPHGGKVIRQAKTSDLNKSIYEFSLNLDSNPQFTASVAIASARAAYRLSQENSFGAKTLVDIPISYLSSRTREDILKNMM